MSDKNYISPQGLQKLKDEIHHLLHIERPKLVETVAWAASNGDRSENADYQYGKRRLRQIDSRLRFLQKRVEAAVVVDAKSQKSETVVFGATVKLFDEHGTAFIYHIVGQDEIDLTQGYISWKSPIAHALLGKKEGDEVTVKTPAGDRIFEIQEILYI